jgi:hypothetical protein
LPCMTKAELPFDVTIAATDFTHYYTSITSGFLDVNIYPDFGGGPPTVGGPSEPFWGLFKASFVGNANTLTLTYGFIPEPPMLMLLSLAFAGLGFARRRKLH